MNDQKERLKKFTKCIYLTNCMLFIQSWVLIQQTNKQKGSTKYRGEAYGAYDGRVRGRVFSTDKREVSISSFYR